MQLLQGTSLTGIQLKEVHDLLEATCHSVQVFLMSD